MQHYLGQLPSITYFVNHFDFCLSSFNTLTNIALFSSSYIFLVNQELAKVFLFFWVFSFLSIHRNLFCVDQVPFSLQLYQIFYFLSSFVQYAPLWVVWRSCYFSHGRTANKNLFWKNLSESHPFLEHVSNFWTQWWIFRKFGIERVLPVSLGGYYSISCLVISYFPTFYFCVIGIV